MERMKRKRSLFWDICFAIYFFVGLFLPPIIHFPMHYIFLAMNVGLLGVFTLASGGFYLNKKNVRIFYGFVPFFLYYTLMQLYHIYTDKAHSDIYKNGLVVMAVLLLYGVVIGWTLITVARVMHWDIWDFVRHIRNASLIEFCLVMAAYLLPSVKSLFLSIMMRNSTSDVLSKAMNQGDLYRCYGFANNLFDAFGYVVSIVIGIILLDGIHNKRKFEVCIAVLLVFMSLVNARTGVVLAAVAFAVAFMFYFDGRKIALYLVLTVVVCIAGVFIFEKMPRETKDWVMSGVDQTVNLVEGKQKSTGVYSEILGRDLVMPPHLLLGEGGAPEQVAYYSGIDSGYVQCLWRYGILGSGLLFFGYLYIFWNVFKGSKKKVFRCAVTIMAAVFFIYLIKLYSIVNYGSVLLLFGLPSLMIYDESKKKITLKEVMRCKTPQQLISRLSQL